MKQRKNSECCKKLAEKVPPWAEPPVLFAKVSIAFGFSDVPFPWRFPDSPSWTELKHRLLESIPAFYKEFFIPKCEFASDLLKEKFVTSGPSERGIFLLSEDLSEGVIIGGIHHLEMFKVLPERESIEPLIKRFLERSIEAASSVGIPVAFSSKWGSLTANPYASPTGITLNFLALSPDEESSSKIESILGSNPRFRIGEVGTGLIQGELGGVEPSQLQKFLSQMIEKLKGNRKSEVKSEQIIEEKLKNSPLGESLLFGDFVRILFLLRHRLSGVDWAKAFIFTSPTHSAILFREPPDRRRFFFVKELIAR